MRVPRLGLLLGISLLGGCWPEPHAKDTGSAGDAGAVGVLSFATIQRDIFDRHCVTDCHEVVNAGAGLALTPAQSWGALVNQRSQQITTRFRVLPGDSAASYLLKKLEGTGDFIGDRMPKGAPRRPPAEVDEVRLWIDRGAPK